MLLGRHSLDPPLDLGHCLVSDDEHIPSLEPSDPGDRLAE